jgi:hypothetical protein
LNAKGEWDKVINRTTKSADIFAAICLYFFLKRVFLSWRWKNKKSGEALRNWDFMKAYFGDDASLHVQSFVNLWVINQSIYWNQRNGSIFQMASWLQSKIFASRGMSCVIFFGVAIKHLPFFYDQLMYKEPIWWSILRLSPSKHQINDKGRIKIYSGSPVETDVN